jgi:archaellum component FlaC
MTADERFDRIDDSFQRIDDSFQRLTRYIMEFREEATQRFQVIDHRLEMLSATVANIDARFPPLTKSLLDFGTLASRLVQEQTREKDLSTDLAERVTKLEQQVAKLLDRAA